jgi:hypothetical protein
MAARELILTVESLHGRGIVHGAIHGRNVIVGRDGQLKLTHVSPLLYVDPQQDMAAIGEMFAEIAGQRGEAAGSPLQRLAEAAAESGGTLRAMGARAAALIDLRRDEESEAIEREADARRRRHSRAAAAIVVGVAILLSYGIRQYVGQITPKPPRAPEAPEAMLKP